MNIRPFDYNRQNVSGCRAQTVGAFRCLGLLTVLLSAGCVRIPAGIEPAQPFELERYLGTWYEIARLDHRFERGLDNVTAHYERAANGSVRVVNRGYSVDDGAWNEALGKAFLARAHDEAYLKVSFFGPFYASYIVFELEPDDYRYAFVTSSSRSYLWLLSRTPAIDDAVLEAFRERASALGFELDGLIMVDQSHHAAVPGTSR